MSESSPDRRRDHGWDSYRRLGRAPDAKRLLVGFTLARLPVGMVALTFVLATVHRTNSLALAGGVSAAYAIAMAVGMPATGRMVDRHGAGLVLLVTGIGYPVALLAFAAFVSGFLDAPVWVLFATAAVAGLLLPPVAPVIRSVWATTLDHADLRTATAIESLLTQIFYVGGPALVGLLAFGGATPVALVVSAVANALGVPFILGSGVVRRLPTSSKPLNRWAALRQHGMRDLMAVAFAFTIVGTGFEFAIIGWADARDTPVLSGLLLAVSCVGALAATAAFGAGYAWLTRISLASWFAFWAIGQVVLGVAVGLQLGPLWVMLASLPPDAVSAPIMILIANQAIQVATPGLRTETFAWRMSAYMVGGSFGATVSGFAAQRLGAAGPSGVGVAVALGAVLIASRHTVDVHAKDAIPERCEKELAGSSVTRDDPGSHRPQSPRVKREEDQDGRALHERAGLPEGVELI